MSEQVFSGGDTCQNAEYFLIKQSPVIGERFIRVFWCEIIVLYTCTKSTTFSVLLILLGLR